MEFLTPDRTYTLYGLEIKEKILPASLKPNRKLSNGTGKVEYVTVHNTPDINEAKGTNDAEQYARATFNGNMNGVTVHYYIDETDCWHILNDDEVGYHAADGKKGAGNNTSLAIEIVMDGSGYDYDVMAEERGALLAAILLQQNGLSIDRLTTHNRWYPKKYCPAFILPHWSDFKKKVKVYLDAINENDALHEAPAENDKKNLFRVLTGTFNTEVEAEKYISILEKVGFDGFAVKIGNFFKVQVGAFSEKPYAEEYVKDLNEAGFTAILISPEDDLNTVVVGDADGDGKITSADARLLLRASVGLEEIPLEIGDIDGDGKITASDAREALRRSVGL